MKLSDRNKTIGEILGWKKNGDMVTPDGKYGFNTALTSCDREIDREALVEALWDILVTDEFLVDVDFMEEEERLRAIRGKKNVLRRHADHIISTMPTWLKRIRNE